MTMMHDAINPQKLEVETLKRIIAGIVFGSNKKSMGKYPATTISGITFVPDNKPATPRKKSLKAQQIAEDRLINLYRYDAYGMHDHNDINKGSEYILPSYNESEREAYILEVVAEVLYKLHGIESLEVKYESFGLIEVESTEGEIKPYSLRIRPKATHNELMQELQNRYTRIYKNSRDAVIITESVPLVIREVSPFAQLCRIISVASTEVARSYNRSGCTGQHTKGGVDVDASSCEVDAHQAESESEDSIRIVAICQKLQSMTLHKGLAESARSMVIDCMMQGADNFTSRWQKHKACCTARQEKLARKLLQRAIREIKSELITV